MKKPAVAVIAATLLIIGMCTRPTDRTPSPPQSAAVEQVCHVAAATQPLPEVVRETSGLARGIEHPDVLWTHNDSGGEPEIFAIGEDGTLKARVRVTGARAIDWEDIESGRCGNMGCLYVADTGDNAGQRRSVTVYEIAEPALTAREQPVRNSVRARYPDGPQDAEALFRLPSGELYIVTKGRQKAIKLYRLPPITGDSASNMMQLVREIAPRPGGPGDWITAATASPDGQWVAVRSYHTLFLYRADDLLKGNDSARTFGLGVLRERQGEALALDNDGSVWVTSEAENPADQPGFARLNCSLK